MIKRLFSRKKNTPSPTPPSPPIEAGPAWGAPQTPYLDYFNLHLHRLDLTHTVAAIRQKYLHAVPEEPVVVVEQQGEWCNAYFAPDLAMRPGFNKFSHEIAQTHDIWLIGYRIFAEQGVDVHYFAGDQHVAGLSLGDDELMREPSSPQIFAELDDNTPSKLTSVIPRPETQHPLDFHAALLQAIGIANPLLTWEEALTRHQGNGFANSELISGRMSS